jgi:undecaprenyl-diphosphatase
MNLDLYLFNFINTYTKKSKTLDLLGIWCAEYLGYALLVFLFMFAIATHHWRLFFIPLLAGAFSRFVLTEIIYIIYKRKRPLEVLNITSLIKKPIHPAFPSGHAAFFFGVSFALLLFNVPLAIAAIIVTSSVCLARIFCSVHWPSDILGGIASALVVFFIVQQLIT